MEGIKGFVDSALHHPGGKPPKQDDHGSYQGQMEQNAVAAPLQRLITCKPQAEKQLLIGTSIVENAMRIDTTNAVPGIKGFSRFGPLPVFAPAKVFGGSAVQVLLFGKGGNHLIMRINNVGYGIFGQALLCQPFAPPVQSHKGNEHPGNVTCVFCSHRIGKANARLLQAPIKHICPGVKASLLHCFLEIALIAQINRLGTCCPGTDHFARCV